LPCGWPHERWNANALPGAGPERTAANHSIDPGFFPWAAFAPL